MPVVTADNIGALATIRGCRCSSFPPVQERTRAWWPQPPATHETRSEQWERFLAAVRYALQPGWLSGSDTAFAGESGNDVDDRVHACGRGRGGISIIRGGR